MTTSAGTTSNMWWIGPLVLSVLRLVSLEAKATRAKSKEGVLVFPAALAGRVIGGFGITAFTALTLLSIGREEAWLLALGAALVILGCFGWPATIILGQDGLRRYVWWRKAIFIPWDEVCGIQKNQEGDMDVFGKYGQAINFTRFHTDPIRFEAEVKWRAKLDRTISASEFPTIQTTSPKTQRKRTSG